MTFEELVRQVGHPLAVVIYSQHVHVGVSFWDSLTFEQWKEALQTLPASDTRRKDVFYRMKTKAQTFGHITTLYFYCNSPSEKQKLVAQAVEKAQAFGEWRWVYINAGDRLVCEVAFSKMKEVLSTFKDWTDTILYDEHKGEYTILLCGKASSIDDWLDVYRRSGPSSHCEPAVNETARKKLGELITTAAGWRKVFEEKGRSSTQDPIGMFALAEMAKCASTIGDCVYVHDKATMDNTTRAAMEIKLTALDGSFGEWQGLFASKSNLSPFETIAMQKMVERAKTIKDWQYVYDNAGLQPERQRRALEEMTKLVTPETASV